VVPVGCVVVGGACSVAVLTEPIGFGRVVRSVSTPALTSKATAAPNVVGKMTL